MVPPSLRTCLALTLLASTSWIACASGTLTTSGAGGGSATSGSATASSSSGGPCAAGTLCGLDCVDLSTDQANCGACGAACTAGDVCAKGVCALECAGGSVKCGDKCVDTQIDPANCGGCAAPCTLGEVCSVGVCGVDCLGGTTLCGDACADTQIDPANCGGCGKACAKGEACALGACGLVCAGGSTACGTACVDTQIDPANCGGCDQPCVPGQSCAEGLCGLVCVGGSTLCAGLCADTQTDPANCGGCAKACALTADCIGGLCVGGDGGGGGATSCLAILQAGQSVGDGMYLIQPDANAPFPVYCDMTTNGGGWTRCLDFVNTAAEDVNDNTWMDNCINWSMAAWNGPHLLVRLLDPSSTVLYSAMGTRMTAWTLDDVTSTAPAANQYQVAMNANLVTLSTGDKLMIAGKSSAQSGCWGAMGNGYGVVVYPPAPSTFLNPLLMVEPYRDQITDNLPRGFWQSNMGWTPADEIVYVPGGFSACGAIQPGTLGSFEMYVK